MSEAEIHAYGIQDVKEFRKFNSMGSKNIVAKESLLPINTVKRHLWGNIQFRSSSFFHDNMRSVVNDQVEALTLSVMDGEIKLNEQVEDFLANRYDREKEISIDRLMRLVPDATMDQILKEFPSKEAVRRKYKVTFVVLSTPEQEAVQSAAMEFHRAKFDQAVADAIEEASHSIRYSLISALSQFVSIVQGKDSGQKINSRSVATMDSALQQFLNTSGNFGDQKIAQTVMACREKLQTMQSWTQEEVKSLGIEEAILGVITAASDEALAAENYQSFVQSITLDTEVEPGEVDSSAIVADTSELLKSWTATSDLGIL